jgi:hypothetical protein
MAGLRSCTVPSFGSESHGVQKDKWPRREQQVRPARLQRLRERRLAGGEHGDHDVVRPTRARPPGSRHTRRAAWTTTYFCRRTVS